MRRETIVRLENGQYNPSLKLAMDISKEFEAAVEDVFVFIEDEPVLAEGIKSNDSDVHTVGLIGKETNAESGK